MILCVADVGILWELSVAVDHTFAVSTGSHDIAVHNEDVPVDPLDPYTWPNQIDDTIGPDGEVVKGYRSLWDGLEPAQQETLRQEMYSDLRNHPEFGELLPEDGTPWPDDSIADIDERRALRDKVWNEMTLGQSKVAHMDGAKANEPRAMRNKIDDHLRSPGGFHEWIPVSRGPAAKSKGVTAEMIRSYTTPTAETNGIRVIFDEETGEKIGEEIFEHNGSRENSAALHEPLNKFWDDDANSFDDAIRKTEELLDTEFILNPEARANLEPPDTTGIRGTCP